VHAVMGGNEAASSGVEHGETLVRFAEAAVRRDENLARSREEVLQALGPQGLLDSAAIVGRFECCVRVADATGIPLEPPVEILSEDIRRDLDLGRFASVPNAN
jgi:hypothetical protein